MIAILFVIRARERARELEFARAREQQQRCNEYAREIDNSLLAARQLALSLATFAPDLIGDRPGAERLLRRFISSVPDELIYGMGLWFEPGCFAGAEHGLFGPYFHRDRDGGADPVLTYEWSTEAYNYPERPWYRQALAESPRQSFTEPYLDADDLYVSSVAAFDDGTGRRLGVVSVDVTLSALRRFFTSGERGQGEFVYVTTRSGRLLFHSEEERILEILHRRGVPTWNLLEVDPGVLAQLLPTLADPSSPAVESRRATGAGWTVHVVATGPGSLDSLRRLERTLFGGLAVIILLMGGALVFVYRRVGAQRRLQEELQADLRARSLHESRMDRRRRLLESMVRRRTAELERLNANKDRLMSMLAHDTRGDFMVIRSYAEMIGDLLKSGKHDSLDAASASMLTTANRAYDSFEEILAWVDLQGDGMVCRSEPICLAEAIAQSCAAAEPRAKLKAITLLPQSAPLPPVMADVGMLATVLRNLLANALKFTAPDGCVVVKTSLQPDPAMALVEVIDHGVGIPAAELPTLLQRIANTSRRGTKGERGLGLGLSICRDLCGKMGGRIWITSVEGEGTTVHFTLPLAAGSPDSSPEADRAEAGNR